MDAQVPPVMALGDPGATSAVVGGKGVSLARLARAGFRVPPGFDVTTGAYLDFVASGGLLEPVLANCEPQHLAGACQHRAHRRIHIRSGEEASAAHRGRLPAGSAQGIGRQSAARCRMPARFPLCFVAGNGGSLCSTMRGVWSIALTHVNV